MLCALTVRSLKPGTFDQFREAFMAGEDFEDDPPEGFVRFVMARESGNPDEVISFGLFDGTVDEMRKLAAESGYDEQLERTAPFVESVGTDGLFEVVEDYST